MPDWLNLTFILDTIDTLNVSFLDWIFFLLVVSYLFKLWKALSIIDWLKNRASESAETSGTITYAALTRLANIVSIQYSTQDNKLIKTDIVATNFYSGLPLSKGEIVEVTYCTYHTNWAFISRFKKQCISTQYSNIWQYGFLLIVICGANIWIRLNTL